MSVCAVPLITRRPRTLWRGGASAYVADHHCAVRGSGWIRSPASSGSWPLPALSVYLIAPLTTRQPRRSQAWAGRALPGAALVSPAGRARGLVCPVPRSGAGEGAANYGRANRQVLASIVRHIFSQTPGGGLDLVYDISHNLAKIETHLVEGRTVPLCVHRKGATRALPPGHPDLPADLREAGQPVLIPGSMGTCSYVLAGIPGGARLPLPATAPPACTGLP